MMVDYLMFEKVWQDEYYFQLRVTCASANITVTNKIYSSNECVVELFNKLRDFLDGKVEECLWENGTKGDDSTACVSLRFLHKDRLGHVLVEVFIELDDGGNYSSHNCCFYVNTEIGLLTKFCDRLPRLKQKELGTKVILNDGVINLN